MTDPRISSGSFESPAQKLEAKHRRAALGIGMMLVGLVFAVPQLIVQVVEALHSTPAQSVTWLQLARWYGLPVLLIVSGYNLYSPGSLAVLVDRVKTFLPGGSK